MNTIDFKPFDLGIIGEFDQRLIGTMYAPDPIDIFIDGESLYKKVHELLDDWSFFPSFVPFSASFYLKNFQRPKKKVWLYSCTCGVAGCNDVEVTIEFTQDTVIWKDLINYPKILVKEFVFPKENYVEFLERLEKFVHRSPVEMELGGGIGFISLKSKRNFPSLRRLSGLPYMEEIGIYIDENNEVALFTLLIEKEALDKVRRKLWELSSIYIPGEYIVDGNLFPNFWSVVGYALEQLQG